MSIVSETIAVAAALLGLIHHSRSAAERLRPAPICVSVRAGKQESDVPTIGPADVSGEAVPQFVTSSRDRRTRR